MKRLLGGILAMALHLMVLTAQLGPVSGKYGTRCDKVTDLVFILDSSTSISQPDFQKQLNFVKYFVKNLNIGLRHDQVRLGALSFSDRVEINFHLKESTNELTVLSNVDRIDQLTGSTYTWLALNKLIEEMFKPENGSRPFVPHVVIVLTDGNSQKTYLTNEAAQRVHNTNIKVFAIAIGIDIRIPEIRGIASYPKEKYFKQTASYAELERIRKSFLKDACEVIPTTPKPPPYRIATTPRPPRPSSIPCREPVDIVFVLDSSTSIAPQDFQKQLDFVKYFVRNLNIGLSRTQVRLGILSFSDRVEINFFMNESRDRETLLRKIDQIKQLTGSTFTWLALKELAEKMFRPENGGRSYVTRATIILTDGNSQKEYATLEAARIARRTIKIFALAIGTEIRFSEIKSIASFPKEDYFRKTPSFDTLKDIIQSYLIEACGTIDRSTPSPIISTTTIIPEVCTHPADIIFILDSSTSIPDGDFKKQLDFIKYFVRTLDIGQNPNQVRLGVLSFSNKTEINFHLKDSIDKSGVISQVSRIRHITGSTSTWLALGVLVNEMFTPWNGARDSVERITVVLTDGNSQKHFSTRDAAEKARNSGIKIFAIGIGEHVTVEELRAIASTPEKTFLKETASYSELDRIKETILDKTCKVVNRWNPNRRTPAFWERRHTLPPIWKVPTRTHNTLPHTRKAVPKPRHTLPPIRRDFCDRSLPVKMIFLVNNIHLGKKMSGNILYAIMRAERSILHSCAMDFETIFEDGSTLEYMYDDHHKRKRNHKLNNICRVGIFFAHKSMNFRSSILQSQINKLLYHTVENFAISFGDIKETTGLRYFIKDENIINVHHIESLKTSLTNKVNGIICNKINI